MGAPGGQEECRGSSVVYRLLMGPGKGNHVHHQEVQYCGHPSYFCWVKLVRFLVDWFGCHVVGAVHYRLALASDEE